MKDEVNRDGRAKKYTNKICRDNHIHALLQYIPLDYYVPVDDDTLVLSLT